MDVDFGTIVRQLPKILKSSNDTMAAMTIYKAAGGKAISDEMVQLSSPPKRGARCWKVARTSFLC